MVALTEGLLELAMIKDQQASFSQVPLVDAVRDAIDMLGLQIADAGAKIEVGSLPVIDGNKPLLTRLFPGPTTI